MPWRRRRNVHRMRYGWRAWSFFGAGALFGLLAGAALYAPPELENQPPPWEHWTWNRGAAAAGTDTAGAAAAQPATSAPDQQSAPAAATPMAAAAEAAALAPAPVVETAAAVSLPSPDPAPQAASFAQPPVKVAKARLAAVARKQAEPTEEHLVDTSTVGAGPAPEPARIEPEAPRAPAEFAPPRSETEPIDASR